MITVIGSCYAHSRTVRLLDDRALEDMIGRNYRDVRAAKRAARSIATKAGHGEATIHLAIEVCGERKLVIA